MTEYERGFAKKCAEYGLTERQAGVLCKTAELKKEAMRRAVMRGQEKARSEFVSRLPAADEAEFDRRMKAHKSIWDSPKNWWRSIWYNRAAQEGMAESDYRRRAQKVWNEMKAHRAWLDAMDLQKRDYVTPMRPPARPIEEVLDEEKRKKKSTFYTPRGNVVWGSSAGPWSYG